MKQIRVHRFIPRTRAEGPGERACLWVQGCSIQCKGCAVQWTWPKDGGKLFSINELERLILTEPNLEGVTFLGGEPFDQAESLGELARRMKARRLGVMVFTGYLLAELRGSHRPEVHCLLANTDLLVDGPFLQESPENNRPWVGSRNQQFHFLTNRYSDEILKLANYPNRLEIRFQADGTIQVNGMFDPVFLREVFADQKRSSKVAS